MGEEDEEDENKNDDRNRRRYWRLCVETRVYRRDEEAQDRGSSS